MQQNVNRFFEKIFTSFYSGIGAYLGEGMFGVINGCLTVKRKIVTAFTVFYPPKGGNDLFG